MKKHLTFYLFLFYLLPWCSWAQDYHLSVDKTHLYLDDTFVLTIEYDYSKPEPNLDYIRKNFDIISQSSYLSSTVINNNITYWRHLLLKLRPLSDGTFQIKEDNLKKSFTNANIKENNDAPILLFPKINYEKKLNSQFTNIDCPTGTYRFNNKCEKIICPNNSHLVGNSCILNKNQQNAKFSPSKSLNDYKSNKFSKENKSSQISHPIYNKNKSSHSHSDADIGVFLGIMICFLLIRCIVNICASFLSFCSSLFSKASSNNPNHSFSKRNVTHINLHGEVGGSWRDKTGFNEDELYEIIKNVPSKNTLEIDIDSCGGKVASALSIFYMLSKHEGPIVFTITRKAYSAATIITSVPNAKVLISKDAKMMIHKVITTHTKGNANDLRKEADDMERLEDIILNILVQKTGKSIHMIKKLLEKGTFFTATEAIDFGLADDILIPSVQNNESNNYANLNICSFIHKAIAITYLIILFFG